MVSRVPGRLHPAVPADHRRDDRDQLQNATSSPVWIFAARAAARTDSKITQSGRKQAEDCLARIGAGCLGRSRRSASRPQFRDVAI